MQVIQQVKKQALYLAYGTDTFTSVQRLGHMAVSGHFLTEEFEMVVFCADYMDLKGLHTGE